MSVQRSAPRTESDFTTTGLDPHVAAMLAYLGWWLTGIIFLLVERHNHFVRFHAAQALVAFGAVSALIAALMIGGFALLIVSDRGFQALTLMSQIVLLAGVVGWLVCLWQAYRGKRWALPGVGAIAERLARD